VALYGEINSLAIPLRDVSSSISTATHDFASLYLTPGLRLKFHPASRISPYAAIGGGYANYEQSTKLISGLPNPASRQLARGVFDFGAGVDVRVWRFIALRGEARDFYTGSPNYNVSAISGGQNNIVATGGFVLR
jgi:opacity protein-like surface antigen